MKYKLIKTYPCSPKLGTIEDNETYKFSDNWTKFTDFPEYWELIQEVPEYVKCTTLYLKSFPGVKQIGEVDKIYKVESKVLPNIPDSDYILIGLPYSVSVTRFISSTKESFDAQELQNSIKNMKHGEWYKALMNNEWIFKFDKLVNDEIHVIKAYSNNSLSKSCNTWLSRISTVKSLSPATQQEVEQYFPNEFRKPLFTTEDGVEIFKKDTFYWIDAIILTIKSSVAKNTEFKATYDHPLFSTKQKAQEYLDSLKPKEETLLEKAKRLYGKGVGYKGLTTNNYYISTGEIRFNVPNVASDNISMYISNGGDFDENYASATVYVNGKWSEIVSNNPVKLNMTEYTEIKGAEIFTPLQRAEIDKMITIKLRELQ